MPNYLQEPKRKVRYGLNPRGNLWANDKDKFGQKMLEKMGWSEGKGLGRSEQGMTQHINMTVRGVMEGLGFEEKNNSAELAMNYQEALEQLNKIYSHPSPSKDHPDSPSTSNEKKKKRKRSEGSSSVDQVQPSPDGDVSGDQQKGDETVKNVINRHRYSKIRRAKDAASYSSKDLSCIFGLKDGHLKAQDPVPSIESGKNTLPSCSDASTDQSDPWGDGPHSLNRFFSQPEPQPEPEEESTRDNSKSKKRKKQKKMNRQESGDDGGDGDDYEMKTRCSFNV